MVGWGDMGGVEGKKEVEGYEGDRNSYGQRGTK